MNGSIARQFDVFAQVVATGSIVECSRELDLPHAEVIECMNQLEDLIGCQIFAITDGSVGLTDSGRKIVTALNEMTLDGHVRWTSELAGEVTPALETVTLEPLDTERVVTPVHFRPLHVSEPPSSATAMAIQPNEEAAREPHSAVQIITLGSHPAIFSHFQEALLAFEEASPDIGIELMLENIDEEQAARLFQQGKVDIAYYYALAENHHFPSRYAWSERISLFVRADHPLAAEEALGAREISSLPYVALGRNTLARTLAEEALVTSGLIMPQPELETDDLYEIMNHIRKTDACFAAFGPMARDFGKMSGIARLAYASGLPQIQVRQAIRPALGEDPATMALAEFLFR